MTDGPSKKRGLWDRLTGTQKANCVSLYGTETTDKLCRMFDSFDAKMESINKGTAMTPKEQIQAEAAKASAKIREAMNEFAEATGMTAQVEIYWHEGNVRRIVESVYIKTEEGFAS